MTLSRIGIKARVCDDQYNDLYANWLIRYKAQELTDLILTGDTITQLVSDRFMLEDFINYLTCYVPE